VKFIKLRYRFLLLNQI